MIPGKQHPEQMSAEAQLQTCRLSSWKSLDFSLLFSPVQLKLTFNCSNLKLLLTLKDNL